MTRKTRKWAVTRRPVIMLAVLAATGCTQHTWAPGPSAVGDFGVVAGRCKLMAMSGQTSGYVAASGSPKFVAAAVGGGILAGGIASAVREQNIFNACMEASGFVAVDAQPAQTASAQPLAALAHPGTTAARGRAEFGAAVGDFDGPPRGLLVSDVLGGGAAEHAGIQKGDIIITYAGAPTTTYQAFQATLDKTKAGDSAVIQVWRQQTEVAMQVNF